MKLSLIVPIYNEVRHLKDFLAKLDVFDFKVDKELIFVDDCSSDGSFEVLQNFLFKSSITLLRQDTNRGKGAALQRGIDLARGDFIVIQDADFEYRFDDLVTLLEPLKLDEADIVYGSRFRKEGRQVHRTFHYLINRLLTLLSNICSGLYLSDMETCYKVFRADILKNIQLTSKRFGFEPEVTAKVAHLKVRVVEMSISYFPRHYVEGKKITWKDGIAAFYHIVYFNLLAPKKHFYRTEMPKRYIPSGTQWL